MDLKESVYDSVDWIHLAQHMDKRQRPVNTDVHFWVPEIVGNSSIT
jgi:hypothetical protein